MTEPRTPEEMRHLGVEFPSSWVGAVMRIDPQRGQIVDFCGSAALLGEDLFLSARHVVDDAIGGRGVGAVVIGDPETSQRRVTLIEASDHHPSSGVDLGIGKFAWIEGTGDPLDIGRPWAGWGLAMGWSDVLMYGYPDELAGVRPGVAGYQLDARFLKGYVTRTLAPGEHFQVETQALELSFPIPKGMSGSPVFQHQPQGRVICGIAIASVEVALIRQRTLTELEEGKPIREEVEQRVVEAGIAVRTSYYLDWAPELLGGRKLGDLLPASSTSN